MDTVLRPMSTSQVLDRTFSLYRNNFVLFAGIALIAPALNLIAALAQLAVFGPPFVPDPGKFNPQVLQQFVVRFLVAWVVGMVVYLVGTAIASSATIYAVSMVHLGKVTTIAESYAKIRPIIWRILGLIVRVFFLAVWPILTGYLLLALLAVGMVSLSRNAGGGAGPGAGAAALGAIFGLLIFATIIGGLVWAVIAFCRYALAIPACTLERLPAKISVLRSKFLTQGCKGSIFLIYLLWLLLTIVLTYVLQLPGLLANNIVWFSGHVHMSIASVIWVDIAQFLGGAIAGPIMTIAIVLMYYDQRVRKEAFDLQLMMQAIEPNSPAQVSIASGAV